MVCKGCFASESLRIQPARVSGAAGSESHA